MTLRIFDSMRHSHAHLHEGPDRPQRVHCQALSLPIAGCLPTASSARSRGRCNQIQPRINALKLDQIIEQTAEENTFNWVPRTRLAFRIGLPGAVVTTKGLSMGWLEAIVLGIVQGLTEFLPVSSSAHQLVVGQLFFSGHDPGSAFTAVSQLGTETAVLIFFFKDIVQIIKQWALSLVKKVPSSDPDARMGWFVIVGSIPIGLLGYAFQDAIDTTVRNLWITVTMLGVIGLVIGWADRVASRRESVVDSSLGQRPPKQLKDLTWRDAVIFGLAQACALIPGVSRSGGTISGGLFMGYSRPAATRYAFLLAIPAIYISGLYKLKDIGGDACVAWGPTIVATVIAGVVGYAVIAWLMRYIATHSFTPFVIYRIVIAVVLAILLLTGFLDPSSTVISGCAG